MDLHSPETADMRGEEEIRDIWKDRGFSFHAGTCDVGDVWNDHGHAVEEIVMLASGAIRVRIGDRNMDVREGDEIVIPTGIDHEIRNVGSTPARILFGYAIPDR